MVPDISLGIERMDAPIGLSQPSLIPKAVFGSVPTQMSWLRLRERWLQQLSLVGKCKVCEELAIGDEGRCRRIDCGQPKWPMTTMRGQRWQ